MATCSRALMMSSLCPVLVLQPKDLWSLFFTILPKKLCVTARFLLKQLQKGEQFHQPPMELEVEASTLPELPQDVLMSIFATLEIPDLVRAGSVCSSWHSAYTCLRNLGKSKQSQTPCLFYTSKSAGENVAFLYSLAENRSYKITLPEPPIRSRSLIGSSNGWLITADERSELHLVNPITGEQISLPSVITMEHVKPIFDATGTINKYELSHHTVEKFYWADLLAPNILREDLYFKAFVFPDPSTGSYIVVLTLNSFLQLSFARAGDVKWTWLPHGTRNSDCATRYRDCLYMDGLLYALTSHGGIQAFDLTGSNVTMRVIIDESKQFGISQNSMYIIQAPWGDLLQVWRTVGVPQGEDKDSDVLEEEDADDDIPERENEDDDGPRKCHLCTLEIKVYKVDVEAKELVEISNLPYHMLFLGRNNSLILCAEEHPKLKSNHVYFTDDMEITTQMNNYTRNIGLWDFKNSSKKEIVSQIWSNWPCPTWITPNHMELNLAFSK